MYNRENICAVKSERSKHTFSQFFSISFQFAKILQLLIKMDFEI